MSHPPEPPPSRARLLCFAIALLAVLARLPWLLSATGARAADATAGVGRAVGEPAAQRIERATGLPAAVLAAIRANVPAGGRLVLYSPYGGQQFELDAGDPRGEPARQVRVLFERAKNLLYPEPRDVHFARDADELLAKVRGHAGSAVVVDGTQAPTELAVGGRYSLVHTETFAAGGRLRVWKFEEER